MPTQPVKNDSPSPRLPQSSLPAGRQGGGEAATPHQAAGNCRIETFPNPNPERNYVIECDCPEFTCLCPRTGQPDFARILIRYVPNTTCFELKSLKLYLWSYRNEGVFHEAVTNKILDDLVAVTRPRWMEVKAAFLVRGGITTTVTATHGVAPQQ